MRVTVIGSGVTGLTTAKLLIDKGYDVTIVSSKFHFDGLDSNYTSNFAGANWASFASKEQTQLQEFDKPGYIEFMKLARTKPNSGVHLQYNVVNFTKEAFEKGRVCDNDEEEIQRLLPWYKDFVEEFKIIHYDNEFKFGFSYLGIVISTTIYLGYLFNYCMENGCHVKRYTLDNISDAAKLHHTGNSDYIVNCTGIGALGLLNDKGVFPIRGQTILIENEFPYKLSIKLYDGYPEESFYLMPRLEGGCIIGGCMSKDNWDANIDYEMSERFIQRAIKYCPQLIDPTYKHNKNYIKLVRHQVGFRPGRVGDVRVEKVGNVIHNYGAGGTGYQSSYGTCGKVVELIELKLKL